MSKEINQDRKMPIRNTFLSEEIEKQEACDGGDQMECEAPPETD